MTGAARVEPRALPSSTTVTRTRRMLSTLVLGDQRAVSPSRTTHREALLCELRVLSQDLALE